MKNLSVNKDTILFADGIFLKPVQTKNGDWVWAAIEESPDCGLWKDGEEINAKIRSNVDYLNDLLYFFDGDKEYDDFVNYIANLHVSTLEKMVKIETRQWKIDLLKEQIKLDYEDAHEQEYKENLQ